MGKENAVSRAELCRRACLDDRSMRLRIQMERADSCILNMQDGSGYFRPPETREGEQLVREWLRQETSRVKAIRHGTRGARRWLTRLRNRRPKDVPASVKTQQDGRPSC